MKKSLLPHFYEGHYCFFITFRLADSLPQSVIVKLKEKFQFEIEKINIPDETQRKIIVEDLKSQFFQKYDYQLDSKPYGECVLRNREIAQILYDKILSYNNAYYDVKCFSIMPNHVHLLVARLSDENLPQVDKWMQLIKGGSAYLINKTLNRSGKLWAVESYDRYIRNEKHYRNSFYYTVNNPQMAGLGRQFTQKPFMYRCDQDG
ncbi:MAG: transposase [Saprospiraceae bacterium]|nr:transposase [Saprospiraceae bacterium]